MVEPGAKSGLERRQVLGFRVLHGKTLEEREGGIHPFPAAPA
jgi:hypothetical protein